MFVVTGYIMDNGSKQYVNNTGMITTITINFR
jgi:hypothetical protein